LRPTSPGPADIERLLLGVEADAGLLAFETLRFRDRVDFKVFEPRAQRVLDLRQMHALAQEGGAVNVDFHAHAKTPIRRFPLHNRG